MRGSGEGAVYETSRGWRGYITVGWEDTPKGRRPKRRYYSGTTKAAVLRKIRDDLAEKDKGRLDGTTTPTVEKWLAVWLEKDAKARVNARTWSRYEELVRVHLTPALGRTKLDKLTPLHVKDLHRRMLDGGSSSSTVLQAHRVLARALRVAMEWGLVHRNVATLAGGPTVTRPKAEPLTLDEARVLLDAAQDDRLAARWCLALALGPRQGEVLGLEWDAVDLDEGTIVIRQQLQRLRGRHGCGPKTDEGWPCGKGQSIRCPHREGDAGLHLVRPKSEDSHRHIRLPANLVTLLKRHRAQQKVERVEEGPRWKGWEYDGRQVHLVFAQRNGRPIGPRSDTAAWHALLEKAGVAPAKLHDARHTAATILLMLGEDVKVVQELLGHATPDFTRRVYQHVVPEIADAAAVKIDQALWGKRAEPKDAADEKRRRQRSAPRRIAQEA